MSEPMPGVFSHFFNDIDDWCGTPPGRHPFPPHPKSMRDVLLSRVISEIATRVSNEKIRTQLQGSALELHNSGARGLMG